MNNPVGYVIYEDNSPEQLSHFYQQPDTQGFIPVKKLNQVAVNQLESALFNIEKFKAYYNRMPFPAEITQTLAHFQCWKNIAENKTLTDNDYAVIAESEIILTPNYISLINAYIEKYPYDIIKLQRNIKSEKIEDLKLSDGSLDKIGAVIYGTGEQLDGQGSSFYLIRKNIAKQLVEQYSQEKPFWRSDDFSLFYPYEKIVELKQYLSYLPQVKKINLSAPFFSIIIPAYNVDRYLAQCLDSILAQDYQNYEVLLVNDGSTDYTADIALDYAKRYPQITFTQQRNQGVSAARNAAMKQAKGEYILFLDSDDYWNDIYTLSNIEKLIKEKDYPDLVINSYATLMTQNNNQIIEITNLKNAANLLLTGDFRKDYEKLVNNSIYLGFICTKIIKREIIFENKLFFLEGKLFEDMKWSFDLSFHIKTYCLYMPYFYIYRVGRTNSITGYVRKENLLSLFDVISDNIVLLKQYQNIYPEMYPGLFAFIKDSYDYTLKCYNILIPEDKKAIAGEFQKFNKLADAIFNN